MMVTVLESRRLMAAGPLGVDVGSTLGYVDLIKETRGWSPVAPATTLATDASGWPLADAEVVVLDDRVNQPWNGPDPSAVTPDIGGTYHLSFQGSATLDPDFPNNFQTLNQSYSAATNTTTVDLLVPHNTYALLMIKFTHTYNPASSTGTGVANVKLIQPGYAANTTQIFTNAEVNDLTPFGTVRYLNVDGANNYGISYNNSYQNYTTAPFQLAPGPHTIAFQGLNTTGDSAVLIDKVSITPDAVGAIDNPTGDGSAPPVSDPGFESDQIGSGNYQYQPVTAGTGTGWTYSTQAGITANTSSITYLNVNAPEGTQAAFLQDQGRISQTVTSSTSGTYQINFLAMQRNGYQTQQTVEVLVDGKVEATIAPAIGQVNTLDWSQRKLPTASSQLSGPGAAGEAWEYLVAFANATNTDMWINIPGPATDAYVAQLANLIKSGDTIGGVTYAGLKPNLKINLEFSNEVWGGIFSPFIYNYEASQQVAAAGNSKIGDDGSTDPYLNSQRYYLERTMEITNIFRNAFSSDATNDKVRGMLCSQEGNYYYFPTLFPWFEQSYGSPSNYFYGVGNANYENTSDYTSVDSVINGFATNLADQYTTTERFATTANYYGLQNIAYEGGPGTAGASTPAGAQISLAASRDPRMENALVQLYDTWYAAGGNVAITYDGPFDGVTPNNQAALGDLSEINNPTLSAKYRGVVDLSQAAPTIVTAGNSVSPTGVTTLSVASDGINTSFSNPSVGQTNFWLLNVAVAGNYNLFLQAGPGQATGQVTVSLTDKTTVGSFTVGGAGTPYVTTLALHAGLNTLALATTSAFTATSLTLSAPVFPALGDSSFEQATLPTGHQAYVYNPANTPWTFLGSAGVTANFSDFTSGNGPTPQGQQVGFVQKVGSITQTVNLYDPGVYTLNFLAANRANFGSGQQSIQVIVDGSAVGTFAPTTTYTNYATSSFVLSPGSHTFTFKGLNSVGDSTAFVDGITLVQASTKIVVGDSGFETAALPSAPTNFVYNPSGTAWTFTGSAGVTGNNSYFSSGNPVAPEGQQVAFLQRTGSVSQLVNNWTAGNDTISFDLAQRQNYGVAQTVQVLVDGVLIGTFPPTTSSYKRLTTASFAVAAGSHTITFRGTTQDDATDFLDDIAVNPQ